MHYILFLLTVLAPLPLIKFVGGGVVTITVSMGLLFLFVFYKDNVRIDKVSFYWLLVILGLSFVLFLHYEDIRYLVEHRYLIFAFVVVGLLDRVVLVRFVEFTSKAFLFFLSGSVIAVAWKLVGLPHLFVLQNYDGRFTYFYPFSFSVTTHSDFIRPSGIFDEPGAFAYYLSFLILFRVLNELDTRVTMLLLGLGLITGSFAFFVFALVFVAYFFFSARIGGVKKFFFLSASIGAVVSMLLLSSASDRVGRIMSSEGKAESRFVSTINAYSRIVSDDFDVVFGLPPNEFFADNSSFSERDLADITGNNIFSNLARYGLLNSSFYYCTLIFLLWMAIVDKSNGFLFVGIFMMMAQREYFNVVGYSMLMALMYKSIYYRRLRLRSWALALN